MRESEFRELLRRSRSEFQRELTVLYPRLGPARGLLRWCLNHRVLRMIHWHARRDLEDRLSAEAWRRPRWHVALGGCGVLFANEDPAEFPLLDEAFFLPFQWRKLQPDSPRHPAALRQLAREVAQRVADEDERVSAGEWGLSLAENHGLDMVDLSDWTLKVDEVQSAWSSLAAGLWMTVNDRPPSEFVWSTGKWEAERGKWSVSPRTLGAKVRAARRYARRFARTTEEKSMRLFVPGKPHLDLASLAARRPQLVPAIRAELAARLGIPSFASTTDLQVESLRDESPEAAGQPARLRIGVRPVLQAMSVPPDDQAELPVRGQFYLDIVSPQKAASYYETAILRDIADWVRKPLEQVPELTGWRPDTLATVVSGSPELVMLAVRVFLPRRCLLVYTPSEREIAAKYEALKRWIENQKRGAGAGESVPVVVEPAPVKDQCSLAATLSRELRERLAGVSPESVLFDLTPGKRIMSLGLADAAGPGNRLLCWWHDTDPQSRRAKITSERAIVWQVEPNGARRLLTPV